MMHALWIVLAAAIILFGLGVLFMNLRAWLIDRRERRAARERRRRVDLNRSETEREIDALIREPGSVKRETWIAPELRLK
jgi:hypothetical protein